MCEALVQFSLIKERRRKEKKKEKKPMCTRNFWNLRTDSRLDGEAVLCPDLCRTWGLSPISQRQHAMW